jgi:hypothetical protein
VRPALPAVCCALLLVLAGCSVGYDDSGTTETAVPTPGPTATPADGSGPTSTATGTATPAASPSPTPTFPEPTATAIETPTPPTTQEPGGLGGLGGLFGGSGEDSIAVQGGELPLDPTRVYDRTRRLLGTDAPRPNAVQLLDTTGNTTRPPEFQRLLGLEQNVTEVEAVAFVVGPRTVYVNSNITDRPPFLEHVLAHEFTHTIQFRRGDIGRVTAATASGPDGRFASTAVIEGGASYVEDRYWLAYMVNGSAPGPRPASDLERRYRDSDGAARYALAPYWFGYRYLTATVDSAADLSAVYADPPTTSEQVLHPGVRDEPVPLNVTLRGETEGVWQETFAPARGRVGEAFVRVALGTELRDERAARAAAGWGNDTRIAFNNESGARGYAWVLRFDDEGNASEFDDALADYLDERTGTGPLADDRTGRQWATTLDGRPIAYRLRRTDDRTAVLLLGTPAFADADTTTVRGVDGRVVVTTDREADRENG